MPQKTTDQRLIELEAKVKKLEANVTQLQTDMRAAKQSASRTLRGLTSC